MEWASFLGRKELSRDGSPSLRKGAMEGFAGSPATLEMEPSLRLLYQRSDTLNWIVRNGTTEHWYHQGHLNLTTTDFHPIHHYTNPSANLSLSTSCTPCLPSSHRLKYNNHPASTQEIHQTQTTLGNPPLLINSRKAKRPNDKRKRSRD